MDYRNWKVFLDQFETIRIKTPPDAKKFGARYNREQEFRLEIRNLKRLVDDIDGYFHRGKIAIDTSEIANQAWRDYEHHWRDLVEYADAHFEEGFDQEIWLDWKKGAKIIRSNGHLYHGLEDYSPGEVFDFKVHNGGKLIEVVGNEFRKYRESKSTEQCDQSELEMLQDIANVFRVVRSVEVEMGANLSRAFKLWAKLPSYLLPASDDTRHEVFVRSFLELLRDAIRAYVFGARLSAVSLCRALMESILKEFYVPNHKEIANLRDQPSLPLADLIAEAKKKYSFLDDKILHKIRKKANDILHTDEKMPFPSAEMDDEIFSYFRELKRMIDKGSHPPD